MEHNAPARKGKAGANGLERLQTGITLAVTCLCTLRGLNVRYRT
jgi:hypothetical protein